MKNSFLKKLALGLSAVMVVSSLSACGSTTDTDASAESSSEESVAESSAETESEEESSEATAEEDTSADTLVVGYDAFYAKFSPFFASYVPDQDVADFVSVTLLAHDREGNVVWKGIDGTTTPYNGVDYTYYGIADCEVTENEDGSVVYDFTLRDDIVFSDGVPLTADDVIFNMYVLSDPTYDGGATFYTLPIVGMEEYRGGMESLQNLLLSAGSDNTDFTYWSEEEQTEFFAALQTAGEAFAQEIVDYCVGGYGDYLSLVGNSEVALGMYLWGFGEPSEDGSEITGSTGTVYATADVTIADYWTELEAAYGGDYATLSDTESAGSSLFDLLTAALGDDADTFSKGVSTGESAANIAGIEKTGDYSVRVTLSEVDATAYQKFLIDVAPLHYYGDESLYDYDNNMFGFEKGDMSLIKEKNTQPLGAGPYVFESYENGVVTFSANESYYKGAPKIQTILFKETPSTDKLTGIASGTFDISDPNMSVETLEAIKSYNSNGEIVGDVLTTNLTDYLGYGYIGINANIVKVGDDKASDESKALRKAFATVFAAYRDTVINSYYAEMAQVIQYPISNTSWAAPKPADDGYRIAYSVDADGNDIYTADMTDEQKYVAALDAAITFFKAAGYTWDETTGTFTEAPEGAELTYEIIIPSGGTGDHPAYGIVIAAKEALSTIGITLEVNDPSDTSVWNDALEANTAEMWAGAWQATVDPDMTQVYHSANANGNGTNSNHYGIEDADLDTLILDALKTSDQSYRKANYKSCLEIILDWGVEVPLYQRQNSVVVSTERVNVDTLTPDITTFWGWASDIELLEMN